MQKAAYLAQAAGVGLGYFFRWYLRGPYSPDLTSDAFGIQDELKAGSTEADTWVLDEQSRGKLRGLKPLLSQPDDQEKARYLELLASIHFLVSRNQIGGDSSANIQAILKKAGKNYDLQEVEQALHQLQQHELLSAP
jgi:uncharacterized protein YwgA